MHSLRVKFGLLLFGLLACACLGLAWTAARHEAGALETEIERRTLALTQGLARAAARPLREGNGRGMEHLLRLAGAQQGAFGARILAQDGTVIWALDANERGTRRIPLVRPDDPDPEAPVLRRRGTQLVSSMRIVEAGELLGEAQVEIDLEVAVDPVVRQATTQLALVALGVLVLAGLTGSGFVSLLVGPLRRLHRGVDRLAAGDLEVRVPPTTRDEVGELTRAFNAMGESLQQKARIQSAFGRYASDYVLGQLLHAPDGAEPAGAEREVTILFVDVRHFTRLSEGMRARDVVTLLNEFFQLVTDRIHAHGGTIDKFIGDSVMAYFGAPVAQPDQELRAVAAAVDVVRALEERNGSRGARAPGCPDVRIEVGIGIHSGTAVVGNIGSQRRADYTAVGDVVNVAHRIDKLAAPGEILISEAVRRCVRGAFRLRFRGERQLSGRLEPVHVYSVEVDTASRAHDRRTEDTEESGLAPPASDCVSEASV